MTALRIIDGIAADAPTIRLLRNENNIGVIPTLQRGLEAARGKYVYFAASDDWVFPGFFALALRRLEADPDSRPVLRRSDVGRWRQATGRSPCDRRCGRG